MIETRVEKGSGNVFADLGLRNPEEALAKAEICRQLVCSIDEKGLTQAKVAKLLNVSQPRVSDLMRGRLIAFSFETLLSFAKQLGIDVEIYMRPAVDPHLKVLTAGA